MSAELLVIQTGVLSFFRWPISYSSTGDGQDCHTDIWILHVFLLGHSPAFCAEAQGVSHTTVLLQGCSPPLEPDVGWIGKPAFWRLATTGHQKSKGFKAEINKCSTNILWGTMES